MQDCFQNTARCIVLPVMNQLSRKRYPIFQRRQGVRQKIFRAIHKGPDRKLPGIRHMRKVPVTKG